MEGAEPGGPGPVAPRALDIPYTGSDPATLSLALDKALAKKIVRQHGIHTPTSSSSPPARSGSIASSTSSR
jgi:D-alanine-D-alanine ligase-like ATP-grasp enzyme